MSRFRRGPGESPNYSRRQTAQYVSRKARLQRGRGLAPADRTARPGGGLFLWFPSPRGPKKFRGRHRVESVWVKDEDSGGPDDPGGGDGGDGGDGGPTLPPCPATVTAYYWTCCEVVEDRPGYYAWEPRSGSAVQWITEWTEAAILAYLAANGTFPPYGYTDIAFSSLGGGWSELFYYRSGFGIYDEASIGRDFYTTTTTSTPPTKPGYVDGGTPVLTRVDGLLADGTPVTFEDPAGLSNPYCDDGSSPPDPDPDPDPDPPPPPLPDDFIAGDGGRRYRCSCPDFAFEEDVYQAPAFPSQRRGRAWAQTRPRTPCKHIVAAARSLGDQKSVVLWDLLGRRDLPALASSSPPVPETPAEAWIRRLYERMARIDYRRRPRRPSRWRPQWSWEREARELADTVWSDPFRKDITKSMNDWNRQRQAAAVNRGEHAYHRAIAAGLSHDEANRLALNASRQLLQDAPYFNPRNPRDREAWARFSFPPRPDRDALGEAAAAAPPGNDIPWVSGGGVTDDEIFY